MKKKNKTVAVLVGIYIFLVIYSCLFVPVKAAIGEDDADAVYGYCPIWELKASSPRTDADANAPSPVVTIRFNPTAWAMQLLFITLAFIILLIRTLRRY